MNNNAAAIADFYSGKTSGEDMNRPEPSVRGGMYSPAEMETARTVMEAVIVPGSWQDLEARGIPFEGWSPAAKEKFLTDQEQGNFVPPVLPHTDVPVQAANPGREMQPGSWQDYEARGIPFESWPPMVQQRFVDDQTNPPPMIEDVAPQSVQRDDIIDIIGSKSTAYVAEEDEYTDTEGTIDFASVLNEMSAMIHQANEKWWIDLNTGQPLDRNKGELIALMHSELSECLEGVRKNIPDDHLPQYSMEVVELADTIIRIMDYAGGFGLPLGQALMDKLAYNRNRADHKPENRKGQHGKKF